MIMLEPSKGGRRNMLRGGGGETLFASSLVAPLIIIRFIKYGESQFCDYQKFSIGRIIFSYFVLASDIEYTQHTIKF